VANGKIYDPNGREFIPKGANVYAWNMCWGKQLNPIETLDEFVNCWKFNTARIYARLTPQPGCSDNPPYTIKTKEGYFEVVDSFSARRVVSIIDPHDHICGYYSGPELDNLVAFMKEAAQRYINNPYVWFEVQNEPGAHQSTSTSQWYTVCHAIIKAVRGEGNKNIVAIPAYNCGQDFGGRSSSSSLLNHADDAATVDGKKAENIVLKYHVYDQWNGKSVTAFKAYVSRLNDMGYPVYVGEYGTKNSGAGGTDSWAAAKSMMKAHQDLEMGRIVWSWYGGDDNRLVVRNPAGCLIPPLGCRGWLIDDCDNPTNLSELGKLVWYDQHRKEDLEYLPGYPLSATKRPARKLQNTKSITVRDICIDPVSGTAFIDGKRAEIVSISGKTITARANTLPAGIYGIHFPDSPGNTTYFLLRD
jgi:mannan endo-1,4-beta-mannosidase